MNEMHILKGVNRVFDAIALERLRQERLHPDDTCWDLGKPEGEKWDVLNDEVKEVWEALLNKKRANLREELIQVAAVAVAWVQALDRMNAEEAGR